MDGLIIFRSRDYKLIRELATQVVTAAGQGYIPQVIIA